MRFIHFGCWGDLYNKYFSKDKQVVDMVFENIYNLQKKKNIDFFIVAGDNYYPEKIKYKIENKSTEKIKDKDKNGGGKKDKNKQVTIKKKIFSKEEAEYLMQKLNQLGKTVYLLLGNHDVIDVTMSRKTLENTGLIDTDKYNDISNIPVSSCQALTVEQDASKKYNNIKMFKNVLYHVDSHTDTLIIMIDSNIFESKLLIDCYISHGILEKDKKLEKASPSENIGDLMSVQFNQVKKILQKHSKMRNVFFAGHHPLVVYKVEETETMKKLHLFNESFVHFFRKLSYHLKNKKIYYLCADSHFYEESIIDIKNPGKDNILINQYIAGTGGAELDDIDVTKTCKQEEQKLFTYNILYVKKAHGFLLCDYDYDKMDWLFQFNQTWPEIKLSAQKLPSPSQSVQTICNIETAGYIHKMKHKTRRKKRITTRNTRRNTRLKTKRHTRMR